MNMHQSTVAWAIDVIHDYKGDLSKAEITPHMKTGEYTKLPDPLSPLTSATLGGFSMSLAMYEHPAPSEWIIVKVYQFSRRIAPGLIKEHLARGELLMIDYGTTANKMTGLYVFHHMFERIGGIQYRYWSWPELTTPGSKKAKDLSKLEEGYAFLRGPKAPVSNNKGEFIEFADVQSNDPQSKVYGWAEGKIVNFLSTLQRGKQTARAIEYWPFTYRDLEPWFMQFAFRDVIGDHKEFGTFWGGKTLGGKSQGSKTHAFQVSAYQIDKHDMADMIAKIVTAKNFDHFRGAPNTIFQPSIFDDGHLPRSNIEDVKSYIFPSEEDSLLWARWGGSGFDMHHHGQIVTQSFDQSIDDNAIGDNISDISFFRMIRPSIHKEAIDEDVGAICRRSNVIAIMKHAVYFRKASAAEVSVKRMAWPKQQHKDIFKEHCIEIARAYKRGSRVLPPNYACPPALRMAYACIYAV